jgi:hypothetical protein
MSYATKFFNIAIRESNLPNGGRRAAELAEIRVMGAIGLIANTRDEFIREGLDYVENFKDTADTAIEDIEQEPDHNPEIVRKIRTLTKESANVSFVKLFDLLSSDWDERH